MLTVTWQLNPLIVTPAPAVRPHDAVAAVVAGARAAARATRGRQPPAAADRCAGRGLLARASAWRSLGLMALALQIALGGWTSSNYAAIACPDLPTCQGPGGRRPISDRAFVLWRGLGHQLRGRGARQSGAGRDPADPPAGRAGGEPGAAGGGTCGAAPAWPSGRAPAACLLAAVALQLTIGVAMVLRGFPLWLATAHNAGAALLLLATLARRAR